jgi:hypothetical protein
MEVSSVLPQDESIIWHSQLQCFSDILVDKGRAYIPLEPHSLMLFYCPNIVKSN